MNIAIFGEGLMSKVAAALFASVGNQVTVFHANKLERAYANEPQLDKLYAQQKISGRLVECNEDINKQHRFDYILVADISLSSVFELFASVIDKSLKNQGAVINLTPSEIGESENVYCHYLSNLTTAKENLLDYKPICCVPLMVREGRSIMDFSRPDNIILGCDDPLQAKGLKALFYPFNRVRDVIKVVTTKEAEFSHFAGNAMLATRLSFMNEMAALADNMQVDIEVIRECIGSDPRIGNDYLYPSCGYGGNALSGNLSKVADALNDRNGDLGLLKVVAEINERQKDILFRKIWKYFKTELGGIQVAIWGASFKPGTPSIAGAPSIKLIDSLLAQGASIKIYDPLASDNINSLYGNNPKMELVKNRDDALIGSDVLAICTEWKEFWSPDFELIKTRLNSSAIFDGRNLYQPEQLKDIGIQYFGIGRGERV